MMLRQIGNTFVKKSTQQWPRAFATPLSGLSTWTRSRDDPEELTATQHSLWSSYLQTGTGSADLFGSINQKSDGRLNKNEVAFFLSHATRDCEVSPKVLENLDGLADDHSITFREFEKWLEAAYKNDTDVNSEYNWNAANMNQNLRAMEYAVRGEVVMRADELAAQGRKILLTNIGNPHSVGQKPISFFRQVLSLCDLPPHLGIDHPAASQMFPQDALERARFFHKVVGQSGTGAYTNSQGLSGVRELVADFIAERDGHPSSPNDIFLTNGASAAIELTLNALIAGENDAIMVPIPQYPIYSALITRLGGTRIGYELEEETGWRITKEELETQMQDARAQNKNVRGMVLINPGNPTGQVLDRSDLEMVAKFCAENGIVLMADEVYQRNVYPADQEFISAKKVVTETPGCEKVELISYHSTSKGLIGECGRRGGYMEMINIDPYVRSQVLKLASSGLCAGVAGQLMMGLMVSPPKPGDESYESFKAEEDSIFQGLGRRAMKLVDGLNKIPGIECQRASGAMYAFPRVEVPEGAKKVAANNGQTADTLYALSLLDETGICVVPASGFGQKDGRVGFRTTFLPGDEELDEAITMFKEHHMQFCEKYSSLG